MNRKQPATHQPQQGYRAACRVCNWTSPWLPTKEDVQIMLEFHRGTATHRTRQERRANGTNA